MLTENHSRTTVIVWKTSQGLEDDPEKMGIQNVQMRGEGRGDEKLSNSRAKVNPGSWHLLIRIHYTNTGQISAPAARGMGPPCSRGEVSSGLSRVGVFPRRGVSWGPNLWGSKDENLNR